MGHVIWEFNVIWAIDKHKSGNIIWAIVICPLPGPNTASLWSGIILGPGAQGQHADLDGLHALNAEFLIDLSNPAYLLMFSAGEAWI